MRTFRLATVVLAALLLVAPAARAGNPYTPTGVCGAGFGIVAQHKLHGDGVFLGTAYLLYQRSTGRNCAVFIKRRAVGIATFTEVSLAAKGGNYMADDGEYQFYAGPLYVHAPGRCVIYGARMRDARGHGGSWITPHFGHCGR
jgi:hypothetical protein